MKFGRREQRQPVVVTREITVTNRSGLHARPAAAFARMANSFRSEIWLVKDGRRFAATSVIELMRLDLSQGGTATLEAHGTDAEEAIAALVRLVSEFED